MFVSGPLYPRPQSGPGGGVALIQYGIGGEWGQDPLGAYLQALGGHGS